MSDWQRGLIKTSMGWSDAREHVKRRICLGVWIINPELGSWAEEAGYGTRQMEGIVG